MRPSTRGVVRHGAIALVALGGMFAAPHITHAGGGVAGGGVGGGIAGGSSIPGEPVITVHSKGFQVQLPPRVDAGLLTIRWIQDGRFWTGASFARLKPGVTPAQLRGVTSFGVFSRLAIPLGGTGGPAGVQLSTFVTPGNYVVYDVEGGDNGKKPNIAFKFFTVVPSAVATPAVPSTNAWVIEKNFKFGLSSLTWSAGVNVIRVHNNGPSEHMMIVTRLQAGKTPADVLAYLKAGGKGAPPVDFIGGDDTQAAGTTTYATLRLQPGTYFLACFIEDPKTHQPHVAMGMYKFITVR
jgi:hypothetical protein